MKTTKFESHGRSMRWYEWLTLLLLLALAAGVRAESVYKCVDGDGGIAYQAQPCASAQRQNVLTLDPAPAYAPPPQYAVERRNENLPARRTTTASQAQNRQSNRQATSYECRGSDGEVFYRHDSCPHSIAATNSGGRGRGKSAKTSVSVSARAIPRDEACAQLHRAGSIGRAGHEHDESISTYERNLGHDPCN